LPEDGADEEGKGALDEISSTAQFLASFSPHRCTNLGGTCASRAYEVRPRKDNRGVDLISDALSFGRLWQLEVSHAIGYLKFYSRSHDAVIRVYDDGGNVIETHEHAGEFKEW
jgi:hypothetical protein